MKQVFEVNGAIFKSEVTDCELPVLVDFWASWCEPCQMIAPIVENIACNNHRRLKVVKVNADTCSDLVMRYGIMGLLTLILFVRGEVVLRISGFHPGEVIMAQLQGFIEDSTLAE